MWYFVINVYYGNVLKILCIPATLWFTVPFTFEWKCIVLCCFLYVGSVGSFKEDSNAFLFSLVNPSGSEPKKMNAVVGSRTGIHCNSELGPCFGVKDRYNLKIGENHTDRYKLFNVNLGFQCPANVNFKTFFTGIDLFTISELEVFKINF